MVIRIYFKKADGSDDKIILPYKNQKELNSYIYKSLGDNNKYHDAFSDYSISSIQGGKNYDRDNMIFEDEHPYIQVTSLNEKFLNDLLDGVSKRKYNFYNLTYEKVNFLSFNLHKEYDVVLTISPILLRVKDYKYTIKDENYMTLLKEHCIKKLRRNGIEDKSFDIVLRKPEYAKARSVIVGETFNPCTQASFYVVGKPETRNMLYHLGLGGSTGSGFGAVKVYT